MTVLATPTPYLRDGLRRLVAGLRKDAETVRLNLAEAEQDVAAARALLAEAEAQHKRAKDAADRLAEEIAFFEREAARTPPAYDPAAALAATGLMPREEAEPKAPIEIPPGSIAGHCRRCGRQTFTAPGQLTLHAATASLDCCPDGTDCHPDEPGVADSRAQVAPHLPVAPPVPHDPAGPLMTMPDLAPRREPLDPPPGEGVHTHARPNDGLMARVTGGWPVVGRRRKADEQDGDADE